MKSGLPALAAQREFEEPAVEGQSLLDVAHLERDVVQSDSAGFAGLGHDGGLQLSLVENVVPTQLPGNVEIRTMCGSVSSTQGRFTSRANLHVSKPARLAGAGCGLQRT